MNFSVYQTYTKKWHFWKFSEFHSYLWHNILVDWIFLRIFEVTFSLTFYKKILLIEFFLPKTNYNKKVFLFQFFKILFSWNVLSLFLKKKYCCIICVQYSTFTNFTNKKINTQEYIILNCTTKTVHEKEKYWKYY